MTKPVCELAVPRSLKNDAIVAFVRAAVAISARAPKEMMRGLGIGIGRAAFHAFRRERRIALENLQRAFPSLSPAERFAIAKKAYRTLGEWLGEAFARLDGSADDDGAIPFEADARNALFSAIESGRGVLLASAHLGPYERVASSLSAHGVPLLAVTKRAYDPRLDFVYERLRGALRVTSVPRDAPGAGVKMVRHLRAGGVLGIPMDLASRVASIDAPFFGEPARTAVGPARLALRMGSRVVVCTAARAKRTGGLCLAVTEIPTEDLQRDERGARRERGEDGERAKAEARLTARINDELSRRIKAFPEAWPWMHPRFARDPAANPATNPATNPAEETAARGAAERVLALPERETR